MGYEAGYWNTTEHDNTFVGYKAQGTGVDAGILENSTAIGTNATVTTSNSLVLGSILNVNNSITPTTNVGIGTTSPQMRLEVVDGAIGHSGLMLTSLANSTPQVNNTIALSINYVTGEVILVEAPSGSVVNPSTAPVLSSPIDGTTGDFCKTGVLFSWQPISDPLTFYQIQLASNASFTNIFVTREVMNETSMLLRIDYDYTTTIYYWRVRAVTVGGTSPWSLPTFSSSI